MKCNRHVYSIPLQFLRFFYRCLSYYSWCPSFPYQLNIVLLKNCRQNFKTARKKVFNSLKNTRIDKNLKVSTHFLIKNKCKIMYVRFPWYIPRFLTILLTVSIFNYLYSPKPGELDTKAILIQKSSTWNWLQWQNFDQTLKNKFLVLIRYSILSTNQNVNKTW